MTRRRNHLWRNQPNGARACAACKLVVYVKPVDGVAQLWARWPDGVARQIGWPASRRRVGAPLGPCSRLEVELLPTKPAPKPRGGDMWRGRSRSTRALALVDAGLTVTEAARQVGLRPQAVSMAHKRRKLRLRRQRRQKARST